MLRTIAGIIVGLVVMWVIVIATFVITVMAMGWQGTLQPNSYWTTDSFNIIVLVGGTVAAIIGGMTCKVIARNSTATLVLVAIVLALGAGSAVMNMNRPDPPPRTGEATLQDLQLHGKEPGWFAISKTVLGAVGVLIGGAMVKRRDAVVV